MSTQVLEPPTVAPPSRGRVLVVAPQPFYEDRGTPIAVRQVIEALVQLGYVVDLLTFPGGRGVELRGLRVFRVANPLRIRRIPIGFSCRKLIFDAVLVGALRRQLARERYLCIHAVEEAAFPAVMLGHRQGIPVIYDMQSSIPEQLTNHLAFRSRSVQRVLRSCEQWLLRHADLVVSSTGLAARVRHLAPGIHGREWRFPSDVAATNPGAGIWLRRRLGIPAGAPIVAYAGSFAAYQGIPDIVEAIPMVRRRHPDAVFVLVGGECGAVEHPATRALIRCGALQLVPRQPREQVRSYLAMADILVSTRVYGGNVPLKIFDYMAAGRAIVATDIPTHRALLDESRAVLVSRGPVALARAISDLLAAPEWRAELAAAARRYADQHFGWDQFVSAVDDLYRDVPRRAVRRD